MILDKICDKKRVRVEERKSIKSLEVLYEEAIKMPLVENNFKDVLTKEGLSIIGEYKKASPSKGVIVEDFNIDNLVNYYKDLNVDAYSVLTEEDFFKGSDEYLKKIKSLTNRPILRKDFVIDFYQIYEARILGASGILLIAAVLKEDLKEFYKECRKFNLMPLVEVHNREELELALECDSEIIGINNRDLKTFITTLETTENLINYIPKDKVIVSESGIRTIEDLKRVREYGAKAALVGEMFMRNIDNKKFKEEFNLFKCR
ncbi:MAG: indole-3-glycerol phosphate synthase TrpC [Clostridium sp.]|nr:indole-3-glycerol phosphate synthase TrpC [Clostridium sp.]